MDWVKLVVGLLWKYSLLRLYCMKHLDEYIWGLDFLTVEICFGLEFEICFFKIYLKNKVNTQYMLIWLYPQVVLNAKMLHPRKYDSAFYQGLGMPLSMGHWHRSISRTSYFLKLWQNNHSEFPHPRKKMHLELDEYSYD